MRFVAASPVGSNFGVTTQVKGIVPIVGVVMTKNPKKQ